MYGNTEEIRKRVKDLGEALNKALNVRYSNRGWYLLLHDYVRWSINHLPLKKAEGEFTWSDKGHKFHLLDESKEIYGKMKYGSVERAITRGNNLFINFSRFNEVQLSSCDVLMPYKYKIKYKNTPLNRDLRDEIIDSIGSDDPITMQLVKFLPTLLLERLYDILKGIPIHNAKEKIFHVYGWPSEYYKFILFKYLESGSYLIGYQHGAVYGEIQDYDLYTREKEVFNEFRTWGWKLDTNDKPWISYRLKAFKTDYVNERKNIKLNFIVPLNYQDRNIVKMGGFSALRSMLNDHIWDAFTFRARPVNLLKSNKQYLKSFADINLDIKESRLPFYKVLKRSKMAIILSVPSSTLLESITVNHPVCGLLSRDEPLTLLAREKYDGLVKIKVLHKSIESLTNHLNSINGDIHLWWNDVLKSAEYGDFKSTFCQIEFK